MDITREKHEFKRLHKSWQNQLDIARKLKNKMDAKAAELKAVGYSVNDDFEFVPPKNPDKNQSLEVTDHCVLRAVERFTSVPLDRVKEEILTHIEPLWKKFGSGKYILEDGSVVIVVGNQVKTVYKEEKNND